MFDLVIWYFAFVAHRMMHRAQCNQVAAVKPQLFTRIDGHRVVNLQSLVIVFTVGSIQFSDAHLTQIAVSFLDLLPFSVPDRAVSKPHGIINLFALNRLAATSMLFTMGSAAIFAAVQNFLPHRLRHVNVQSFLMSSASSTPPATVKISVNMLSPLSHKKSHPLDVIKNIF